MAIQFRILGELEVVQDGDPRDLGSMRQRGLLARLLIRAGGPVTSDWLMEELWPDEVPDKARHTLHVYVSRLRGALGDGRERLASDASGYRLQVEADELDAARFEWLTSEGRSALVAGRSAQAADLLREALGLWRGPALAEFADETFATPEATRLDQLRLAALEERIRADLELGRHLELAEELHGLTLEQPFREAFWEQYMLALYRGGRQADALRAYAAARTKLADELGIEPGPALKRMEQRVLAHDSTLSLDPAGTEPDTATPVTAIGNLPLQRTTFVGRERDLAIAAELLVASRLLTLTGAPGAGKTRMALRLATEQATRFPAGTFFVSLAGISDPQQLEPAITRVLDATGHAAGDTTRGPDPGKTALAQRLQGPRLLLVLDNLEQLSGAAGPIDRLLDAAPALTVLATSRAPLGVDGEQEFPVLPLEVPPTDGVVEPSDLRGYDAVALLVARARAADPRFEVSAENAAAIAGITKRLDGLPLALELGAGRLRAMTPQSLLDRLERRLPLLSAGTSDTIGRHQTLREAIAWSYELLSPDEQRLFRRLAPFVGAFTAEAAAAAADEPLEETWAGVESLLAQSLLYRPVDIGQARFAMLQTLREFAVERLEQAGELRATLDRHARYYLGLTERSDPGRAGDLSDEAVTTLLPELDEIRAALRRCAEDGHLDTGLRLAGATWRVWQAAGRISEGRAWLERLLAEPGADAALRADALAALAGLDYWLADYGGAREAYEQALASYRELEDQAGEADMLYGLSMTATWRGDPTEGADLAAEARHLFETLGDRAKVGETLMAQGFALWQDHQYAAARPRWEEALAISRETGADTLAVTQLAGLAGLEFHTGAPADATRIAVDALDQACDLENVALCVWLLDFIAAFAVVAEPVVAVRVAGAADALRAASGGGKSVEELHIEPARSAARRSLDHKELGQAWTEGHALDLEQAIEEARSLRPVSIG